MTVWPYEGNESEQISAVQHFQVATFMRALLFFHLHFALGLGRQYAIKILPFFFSAFTDLSSLHMQMTPLRWGIETAICRLFDLPTC